MQNLKKQNEKLIDLAHFQVEELEERFENCWRGYERVPHETIDPDTGSIVTDYNTKRPC